MARKKRKSENSTTIIFIIIAIVAVFAIGNKQGWFKSDTNTNTDSTQNYYCCDSGNSYSCSLNSCSFGSSQVYTGSFNTLSGCNAKCVTPTVLQSVQQVPNTPTLTCQQIAEAAGASYKNTPVSTAKECLDFAKLDCQDTGKIMDGYGVQGDCCYFTCIGIVTPDPIICHDSDSDLDVNAYLQNRGTCHDSTQEIQDSCVNDMLNEYYCEPGMNGGANMCGYTSYNCEGMIPGTHCSNGRCVY